MKIMVQNGATGPSFCVFFEKNHPPAAFLACVFITVIELCRWYVYKYVTCHMLPGSMTIMKNFVNISDQEQPMILQVSTGA